MAIEVVLATKSAERLRAILWRYAIWRSTKGGAVIYVCADDELCQRVRTVGRDVGLPPDGGWLRVELLETIKAQAYAGYEAAKSERYPSLPPLHGPCLRSMAADKRKPKKKAKSGPRWKAAHRSRAPALRT